MKTKITLTLTAFLLTLSINAYAENNAKKDLKQTVLFSVPMHCKTCANKIERNIAFGKGVTDLKIDLPANTVSVTFKPDKNTVEGLIAAFKKIGFNATVIEK